MIRSVVYRGFDIYSGFEPQPSRVDLQGWGSDHPILTWAIAKLDPTLIIEVGSWKGRSAINMAKAIRDLGGRGEILCIDTWLGSPEHWLGEGVLWDSLKLVNGRPQLYDTFMNNVVCSNYQDLITPISLPSESAYFLLKELSISCQMVYLDAGHEYQSVLRDLKMYWDLLDDVGLMIVDDYLGWEGVTRAVNEFALTAGVRVCGELGKAVLSKNANLGLGTKLELG